MSGEKHLMLELQVQHAVTCIIILAKQRNLKADTTTEPYQIIII